jgi:hypothetical protein
MRRQKRQKAQSLLEYIIVWTAIVAAIIAIAGTLRGKVLTGLRGTNTGDANDSGGLAGQSAGEIERLATNLTFGR